MKIEIKKVEGNEKVELLKEFYEALIHYLESVKTTKEIEEAKIKQAEERSKIDVGYIVDKIGNQLNMNFESTVQWIKMIEEVNPAAVVAILLKKIAIELDKFYPDYISKSEHIFIVSLTDGEVHELNKSSIKSFKGFAAFRTYEDALFAKNLINKELDLIFPNGKQKD